MNDEVAIIGAGLSGLTLALALHQQGIQATVYESRAAPLNIGGAVMLSPNALKVLDALGLYAAVRARGYNFETLEVRETTGGVVETYEFGGRDRYGYAGNRIYRHELIEVILSAVRAQDIAVVYGRKYARVVDETDEHVVWESVDGARSSAGILVGADGIHSSVRRYLHPAVEPTFIGMAGISAAVSASQVRYPYGAIDRPLTIISPGKTAFVIAPQRADASEMFIGKQRPLEQELSREGWDRFLADKEGLVRFLQEDAEAYGELAVTATRSIPHDRINVWPFYVIPKLDSWASEKRRVVVLGDSAHAIPPSAGQGINQAFEDVYMFALLLAASRPGGHGGSSGGRGVVPFDCALSFWQAFRQHRIDRILDLNKQIDLRRLPPDQRPRGLENVVQQEFDLSWLYEPDFKAEVDKFVQEARE